MSRRPLEWNLVDQDSDPVPASQYDVSRAARDFAERGAVMTYAAKALKALESSDDWKGEAATKLRDEVDKTDTDLGKAAKKYIGAAEALVDFGYAVDTARDETAAAVRDAQDAKDRQSSNSNSLIDDIDEPTEEQRASDNRRIHHLNAASDDLAAAKTRCRRALDDLDLAAERAANAINSASEDFKDSRWDNFSGAVKVIVKMLTYIAIAIVIVIVILAVVVTLGAFGLVAAGLAASAFALASTLGSIAAVLGVIIFGGTLINRTAGDASDMDLAMAGVGAFGGPILGKVFGKLPGLVRATGGARVATRGAAVTSAAQMGANARTLTFTARVLGAIDDPTMARLMTDIGEAEIRHVDDATRAFNSGLGSVAQSQAGTPQRLWLNAAGGGKHYGATMSRMNFLAENGGNISAATRVQAHSLGLTEMGAATTSRGYDLYSTITDPSLGFDGQTFEGAVQDRPTRVVPVGR